MGYRTYDAKVKDVPLKLKMPKDTAEKVVTDLKWLYRMHQYRRELTGIRGGKEDVYETMSLFGPSGSPIRNPETYPADVDAFLAELSGNGLRVLTEVDLPMLREKRNALKELHIPILDSRTTQEERTAKDAEYAQLRADLDAKQQAETAAIVAEWGSGETVTVPADHTAVYLQQTYDDSDAMSDYFHRHASYGPPFLLAVYPGKARQSEALARAAVSVYPGLSKVEFTWHTETYSMGHGNYLMSKDCPGSLRESRHSTEPLPCAFEVQFAYTYQTPKTYHTWQTYPGTVAPLPAEGPAFVGQGNGHGTPRLNAEKGGVEIRFASRPDDATLAPLRAAGWRWSRFSKCWYTKDTPASRQFAAEFTGVALA